jgi:AcrR family transcriptional regulator
MRAAIAVVSEEGVSAATFETIARRGAYSRGLVTQRFGSKRGLIEAVIGYLRARPEAVAIEQRIDELCGLEGVLIDPTLNIDPIRRTCEQTLRTTFAVTKKGNTWPVTFK